MKKISIIIPTFNEEENIDKLFSNIIEQMSKLNYDYEIIVIDNASTDNTEEKIKSWTDKNKKIKAIFNIKNFGHIRSPFYALLQSTGDASITMPADMQDPIDLIPKYLDEWEKGNKVILAEKESSDENKIKFVMRKIFYKFINKNSHTTLTENTTGSGLYDSSIVNEFKKISDPYPYIRGLVNEIAEVKTVKFKQEKRIHGSSKSSFFELYDIAMLGIIKLSRAPLRIITLIGFISSILSFFVGMFYFIYKLINWNSFELGLAPIILGIFILGSIQIFMVGIIGEYIGIILIHQRDMPLVVEKKRINFD